MGSVGLAALLPLQGTPVYMRAVGLVVTYPLLTEWTPPSNLREHSHVPGAWSDSRYRNQMVLQVSPYELAILQRSRTTPSVATAERLGREVLGASAQPQQTACLPLAVRVPLLDQGCTIAIPADACRCRSVWPSKPKLVTVANVQVELRISLSRRASGPPRFYAEAFVGNHLAYDGHPESALYVGDVRRLLIPGSNTPEKYIAQLLDRLFMFLEEIAPLGLQADTAARLPLPILARAEVLQGLGDVAFDVRMPTTAGRTRLLSYAATMTCQPVKTASEIRAVKTMLEAKYA